MALNHIMILHDENYAFFVAFKKNKTYALRWTNQADKVNKKEKVINLSRL